MLHSVTPRAGVQPVRARRGKNSPAATVAQAALPGYPLTRADTLPDTSSAPDLPHLAWIAADAYRVARALVLDLHSARDSEAMRALDVALALQTLAAALPLIPVTRVVCRECGAVSSIANAASVADGQEGARW